MQGRITLFFFFSSMIWRYISLFSSSFSQFYQLMACMLLKLFFSSSSYSVLQAADPSSCGSSSWSCWPTSLASPSSAGQATAGNSSCPTQMRWGVATLQLTATCAGRSWALGQMNKTSLSSLLQTNRAHACWRVGGWGVSPGVHGGGGWNYLFARENILQQKSCDYCCVACHPPPPHSHPHPPLPGSVSSGVLFCVSAGGSEVGQEEKQAQNELREAEPRAALLLR